MMDVRITCPFGHQCERAKDGAMERCALYTKIVGRDPQSEQLLDEWRCSLAWMPLLMVENAQTNRGQTEALESFRNQVVEQQMVFNGFIGAKVGVLPGKPE